MSLTSTSNAFVGAGGAARETGRIAELLLFAVIPSECFSASRGILAEPRIEAGG
jgi:hypothetical protein